MMENYITNETLGIAAEKVICDLRGIDSNHLIHRSNITYEERIKPLIKEALNVLPKITRHSGQEKGIRGGQSKSVVDFYADDKTISIKTTKNKSFKLCPSECGQPGNKTFDLYFGHLYEGSINNKKCKELVINKIDQMIPIYLDHLFDCDFLLLIYINSPNDGFYIYEKKIIKNIEWRLKNFSFTRGLNNWNESTTVKYKEKSIGEFQIHNNRNCYKFRFNILNLSKFIVGK